jgi:hypothetical protein
MSAEMIPYVGLFDVARASRLGLATARATSKNVERIFTNFGFVRRDEVTGREFLAANVAARLAHGSALRTWQRNYLRLSAPYRLLLARKTRVKDRIVLGWEMSPGMKRWLDGAGVAYVDVRLSPMRFYDDLLLDVATNTGWLDRMLSARLVRVTQPELMRTAQAAAIDTSAADTLVLVGQVAGDSSLIGPDGREMALSDFAGQIRDLACQYRRVVYRPHPKGRPANDPVVCDLERDREPSIYAHMAQGASFCAISSSALEEAAVFGCPTFRLAPESPLDRHADRYLHRHVHVLRSSELSQAGGWADGNVPILRFVLGHNASDLGPLRARPGDDASPAAARPPAHQRHRQAG